MFDKESNYQELQAKIEEKAIQIAEQFKGVSYAFAADVLAAAKVILQEKSIR